MPTVSSDFASNANINPQELYRILYLIQSENTAIFNLETHKPGKRERFFMISSPRSPGAPSLSIKINTKQNTIECNGDAASCHTYADTIDMVTRWAAGFLTGNAKNRVLALNPSYETPASVRPSPAETDALFTSGRAQQLAMAIPA